MAINTKKFTYIDNTPILVDYATNDSQGNNIVDTYATKTELKNSSGLKIVKYKDAFGKDPTFNTLVTASDLTKEQFDMLVECDGIEVGSDYDKVTYMKTYQTEDGSAMVFTSNLTYFLQSCYQTVVPDMIQIMSNEGQYMYGMGLMSRTLLGKMIPFGTIFCPLDPTTGQSLFDPTKIEEYTGEGPTPSLPEELKPSFEEVHDAPSTNLIICYYPKDYKQYRFEKVYHDYREQGGSFWYDSEYECIDWYEKKVYTLTSASGDNWKCYWMSLENYFKNKGMMIIPTLPEDNLTNTYQLQAINGILSWVKGGDDSQDSKDFEVINLKDIVPSFNPSSDYTEESPLTITLDAETFNKLHRENIILKAPSCLNTELSSVFYIPSEKQSVTNAISFRCIQFSETMEFGSYYDDIYFETITIVDMGGTYALGYMSKIITNQSKYNISVSGDTLTITENY